MGEKVNNQNSSYGLFRKIGVINQQNKIFSELLEEFLKYKFFREPKLIEIVENRIVIDDKPSDHIFTKSESTILKKLVILKDKILSREELFEAVWKGDLDKYSDWNLDQLVKRVRRKLQRFHLDSNLLTVKGRGFMWYEG